jgi:WD40 repeat protein
MRRFEAGGRRSVTHLRFRPDGAAVTASLRASSMLYTWDLATGTVEPDGRFPTAVTCFDYSPDGSLLAVGGDDGVARPFRCPRRECLLDLRVGHTEGRYDPSPVLAVAFSGLTAWGQWLGAAGAELWLWNPATKVYLCVPEPGQYTAVAFSPCGEIILAADVGSGDFIGWRVKPFQELFRFGLGPASTPRRVTWLPDGEAFLASDDAHVECRTPAGRRRWRAEVRGPRSGADLAVTPDGRQVALADLSHAVKLLDAASGSVVREYDWGVGKVSAVAVSPDGTMAAAGGEKGRVVVWDLDG